MCDGDGLLLALMFHPDDGALLADGLYDGGLYAGAGADDLPDLPENHPPPPDEPEEPEGLEDPPREDE